MTLNRVACDVCEGTGRLRGTNEREMTCYHGCDNGFFDATARDLDGKRARHLWVTGFLLEWSGALVIEHEDFPGLLTIVDPLTVELLS